MSGLDQGDQPSTGGCGPSWYCHILAQCHSATFEKAGPCFLQESNQPKPRNPCFAKCTASTLMPVMCHFLVNFSLILFYYKYFCTGKIPGKPAREAPRAVGGPGCSRGAAPGAQGAGILLGGVVGCPRSAHGRFAGFIRGLQVSPPLGRPIPMGVWNAYPRVLFNSFD